MKKKMGRPISQTPKRNIIGCKLSDVELERLEKYCMLHNLTKSMVLRNGIKDIISESREG